MHHSLEARVPFLDHRLVELAARIPLAMHFGPNGRGKTVLRRAISTLLPPELLGRRKRGFGVPVDAWFRGHLHRDLEDRLLDSNFAAAELVDRTWVKRLLNEHASGFANHGHLLWGLLSLAVWSR